MKKFICIVLCVLLSIALCSCAPQSVFNENTKLNAQDTAQDMADNMMDMMEGFGALGGLQTPAAKPNDNCEGPYEVVRIVDGDTFILKINGAEKKARLIGVDTPESVATGDNAHKNCEEGKTASNYTKSLIEGKKIYVEFDAGREDKYERLLVYAYLPDGTMLNRHLLQKGYARMMTVQPNVKYVETFKADQKTAIENNVGFWDSFAQWED